MDVRWLHDFLAVAETCNFTRAAEIRHLSQAAFSRRIQNLEEWLGIRLIDRASFPTQLTLEGKIFRERAVEIVQQITEARLSLTGGGSGRQSQVRVALPHALATGRLPSWWSAWSHQRTLDAQCIAVPGNVHDTVTALVSGTVDILICFSTSELPIHLPPKQYERVTIGTERMRPYVATQSAAEVQNCFPGLRTAPLSLLMYSPGAYLARVNKLIIELAPQRLIGRCVFESDMADVLRNMAVYGHGVAWLPDCTAEAAPDNALKPIEANGWSLELSVVAYRDRERHSPASDRFWSAVTG
jgi:DNA-binding transcriptional LysR family regulator